MAWTAPKTWVGNEVPTAANLNAQLRDNLNESMVAKATNEGDIFVGNGVNSIAARQIQAQRIVTAETTTSTSYTDLATSGPAVTVTHGTAALVMWSSQMTNTSATVASSVGFALSGSNTAAAADARALVQHGVSANQAWRLGNFHMYTTLTAGTTTFTLKYKVSAGTGGFADRFIAVIPL